MILSDARPARLLLDTCAVIYLFNGEAMSKNGIAAVDKASSVVVSPISAWEIGILGQKFTRSPPAFLPVQSFGFDAY